MPRWHEFNDLSINHLSFDCQLTVNSRVMRPPTIWRTIIANGEIDMALVSDTIAHLWYSQRSVVQAISIAMAEPAMSGCYRPSDTAGEA